MFHFLQLVTSILFWEGLIFRWYNYNPEMAVLNIHDRCLLNWNTFGTKFTFPLFTAETKARFYGLFPLLLLKTEKYSWLSVEFSPILEILILLPNHPWNTIQHHLQCAGHLVCISIFLNGMQCNIPVEML